MIFSAVLTFFSIASAQFQAINCAQGSCRTEHYSSVFLTNPNIQQFCTTLKYSIEYLDKFKQRQTLADVLKAGRTVESQQLARISETCNGAERKTTASPTVIQISPDKSVIYNLEPDQTIYDRETGVSYISTNS